MLYDLFICHASEDKDSLVRPLAEALRMRNAEVWYDEFTLRLGDSIRRAIDKGLTQSRFGVVVLSKAFFAKKWPQYELDGLAEREMAGRDKVILPIWHEIAHDDVMQYSPSLAGLKAVSSSSGIDKIVGEILSVIRPDGSPLINARDTLLCWGVNPPVITDPYWLNVVEASNRLSGFGAVIPRDQTWERWSFPLPGKSDDAREWGERLAWTAMQMDWVKAAEEVPITIISPPDQVLSFVHAHPGLFETCKSYPDLVAEYAPQLTIPGLGGDLEECIEEAFQESCRRHQGKGCDEEWIVRHSSACFHEPGDVASSYFAGGLFGPEVSPFEHADHVFWLLSSSSSWLHGKTRAILIAGMKEWGVWDWHDIRYEGISRWESCGALIHAMYRAAEGKRFRWNAKIREDLAKRIELAISILELPDKPEDILPRFVGEGFHKEFINNERRRRKTPTAK
jgi:hypothetical protein